MLLVTIVRNRPIVVVTMSHSIPSLIAVRHPSYTPFVHLFVRLFVVVVVVVVVFARLGADVRARTRLFAFQPMLHVAHKGSQALSRRRAFCHSSFFSSFFSSLFTHCFFFFYFFYHCSSSLSISLP